MYLKKLKYKNKNLLSYNHKNIKFNQEKTDKLLYSYIIISIVKNY